ncbi:MAG: hypothetical protein GKR90_01955 [Pseudomonadales bacterium]|nr:hypothetical protein [Pseudomonadales bacterium]
MIRRLLFTLFVILIALNLAGIIFPNDRREELGVTLSYEQALKQLDDAHERLGPGSPFLHEASAIYARAINYVWPLEWARIPARDNWILFTLSFTDPIFTALGLSKVDTLFKEFQSLDYTRALKRGFGICSQNAIAMSDLLYRRYDIESHVVGLEGHVILEAVRGSERTLLDPSIGLAFDLALDDLTKSDRTYLSNAYLAAGHPELGVTYDEAGNIREPLGPQGYQPRVFLIERFADWLIWLIPLLGLLTLYLTKSKTAHKAKLTRKETWV